MRKILVITLFVLISTITVLGQDKKISGQVTEQSGAGFPGVYVIIEGTSIGVTTNADGFYQILIPKETENINFSYIGYKTQTIEVVNNTEINELMEEDELMVKSVKVQGFATATTLARRRIESLQTTPEPIVAMTSVEIEDAGIGSIPDFIANVPNASFTSTQNIGTNVLTVRGITLLRNAEAPIAIIIDGVNVPNPSAIDQDMFDIEQIELVKGPQGALYGRNAIAGALNITTKKPTNRYSHFFKASYANGNTYNATIGSSGAIIKNKLLYRIGASTKNSDGLIENDFLKKKVDFYDNKSVRAQLIFNAGKNFSADIVSNYNKTYGGAIYYAIGNHPLLEMLGGNNGVTEPLSASDTHVKPTSDELGESNRTTADASLRLNFSLPFARLTTTTAYSQINWDFHGDIDFSPLREATQTGEQLSDAMSQEIRLTSNTDKKFSWVAGTNYQIATRKKDEYIYLSSAGFFAPVYGFPQTDMENETLYTLTHTDEENINTTLAFFGQASYKIAGKTEIAVGLRYDSDKREQTNLLDNTTREHTFNQIQPKVNLSHKFGANVFTFISYSKGYRSGGFNNPSTVRYPVLYDAEYTDNYELGIKTNWINNRIIANVGVFFIDFKNTQTYFFELETGGPVIVNLGKTQNTGAEAEFKFRITKNLDIYASGGIMNPVITDMGNAYLIL